ncbi:hypothetical protein Nepgr_001183 [Nepenthes gracilis]|uniref:Ankyrin repeat domain-containing protein EMB506, chloroplastic n=1 Tax=Nepenthes gracilis TaxID=150966 RepID=A0AAD3RWS8_NEPGR|nr:hypothetical protein Nepgr_001183 [Nepenthes gracilis]
MALWTTVTFLCKHHPLLPIIYTKAAACSSCRTSHCEEYGFTRSKIFNSSTSGALKASSYLVGKEQSCMQTDEVKWEDPDDGSGSDYDEEAEERDLDWESDWEEEKVGSVVTVDDKHDAMKYEDKLVTEVEQLLVPEERAILQQNGAANLDKISTAKWSPLHTLALSGQIHFLDRLLESGVDIDFSDKDGRTALHVAVIGKKEAVISHLLRKGANPHVKDKDGATPLHYAVQVGAMQTVKLLIKYSADVNITDDEGWTPLHVAIQSRNRDIAKILLVCGADKTRKNEDGKTPLDLSLAYGKDFKSYDLAKLLKLVPGSRHP